MIRETQAWQITTSGAASLRLVSRSVPQPGHGEVLVQVRAVSLNYRDKLVIEGRMAEGKAMPFTPGSDMAGTVVAVGPGVTRARPGDRVIGNFWTAWLDGLAPADMARHGGSLGGPLPGMLAEHVVLPEAVVVTAPRSLTDAEAATLPIAYLTAWFALVETGRVQPGQTVVLQGTGGVSLAGLQIAQALGAHTILTSRSAEKLARAASLHPDCTINTRDTPDWAAAVLDMTAGVGAQHVLDVVGGDNLARSLAALAPDGRIAVIGFLDDMEARLPLLPFMLKRAVLQGITVGHRRALEDLVRFVDAKGIKPVVGEVFAFADAPAAFAALDEGPFGKIVVTLD